MEKIDKPYKDFSVTDYLPTERSLDINYNKYVITEKHLHKPKASYFATFERIRADKILAILAYLNHRIYSHFEKRRVFKDEETFLWFKANKNLLINMLDHQDKEKSFLTPKYLFQQKLYNETDQADIRTVGRLYSSTSIQGFSREIRDYIFKNEYMNFDMVNAHPTILNNYAIDKKLALNGSLAEYIENRDVFINNVSSEFQLTKKLENMKPSDIKEKILKHSNRSWKKVNSGSFMFDKLDSDFATIREALWQDFDNGKFAQFEDTLNIKSLMKGRDLKVSLQRFFCQTTETTLLLKLITFLKQEYIKHLSEMSVSSFTHYYPRTDKKLNLSAEHTLSVVPFFDSIYISSPDQIFNNKITELVDNYNKANLESRFVEKSIEMKTDCMETPSELDKMLIITSWLSKSQNSSALTKYLDTVDFVRMGHDYNKIKTEDHAIFIKEVSSINDKIKADFFEYLFSKNIETEADITDSIRKMER